MKLFIYSSAIIWGLLVTGAKGQSSKLLDHYIELGIANNLALQQEDLELKHSIEALRQAKGMFLPSASFNASYTRASGGRNIIIPVGDVVNPIYKTLNQLTDQNQFPTDVGNVTEQLLPDNFHDTRIEIRQPLFNSDLVHNYRAQQAMVSLQEAKKYAYKKELVKEIKVAYFQYLQTLKLVEIYRTTEGLLLELVRVNKRLVDNDKATLDVVYRAEFELSDLYSKMAEAEKDFQLAKSYFNFLLNIDLEQNIEVDTTLTPELAASTSLKALQNQAINKREELKQLDHAIEAQNHQLNLSKGKKLPNISLGVRAGYQGFGYDFNNTQDYALVQFNLEFPLFKGFQNNSRVQQSRIRLRKLELEQESLEKRIKIQTIEAYRNLEASRAAYQAQKASALSAERTFRIIQRKYQENMVLLVEYLDARTNYTNSQTSLAIARYQVMIRGAELERAISL